MKSAPPESPSGGYQEPPSAVCTVVLHGHVRVPLDECRGTFTTGGQALVELARRLLQEGTVQDAPFDVLRDLHVGRGPDASEAALELGVGHLVGESVERGEDVGFG